MADTKLVAVAPHDVPVWAELVAPHLVGVQECSSGKFSVKDVLGRASGEQAQLWAVIDDEFNVIGSGATELVEYPGRRVCRLWLVGGEIRRLMPHLQEIEQFARDEGCASIEIDGREALKRVLAEAGFDLAHVCMSKEL